MTLRFAPGRTVLLGTLLVLALVVLQPVALGFFPVGTPGTDSNSTDSNSTDSNSTDSDSTEAGEDFAGIGMGTGDLTAGALSALVRDLNGDGGTPPHARSVSPVVLVLLADLDDDTPRQRRMRAAIPDAPATTLAGSSAHGYQLLL